MTPDRPPLSPDIPESLRAYLETIPEVTQEDLAQLRASAASLYDDPAFCADLIKGRFVCEMLEAMEETGKTQSDVARAWGKSRQYLHKLLNEDKRVNFTVDTLCELAHLLNRRIAVMVLRENEYARVMTKAASMPTPLSSEPIWQAFPPSNQRSCDIALFQPQDTPRFNPILIKPDDVANLAA